MTSLIAETARRPLRSIAQMVATPLVPRDFIDLIDPLSSSRDLRGRVAAVTHETADAVTVRIGQENPYKELQSTSVVASGYGSQVDMFATLGVVGPTRMDYPGTIANVAAVALYIGEVLGSR